MFGIGAIDADTDKPSGLHQTRPSYGAHAPVEHEHAAGARDGDGKVPPRHILEVFFLQRGRIRGALVTVAARRDVVAAAAAGARRH